MTFKNGAKEYLLTGAVFGIPMGLLFGLRSLSVFVGVFSGVLSGLLFAFFVFLFSKFMEKKFAKMRSEISASRKVICDGAATLNGNGGWLFLTELGLEFYPHKINLSTKEIRIPLNTVYAVNTQRNQIILNTASEPKLVVIVNHSEEWKKQIDTAARNFALNN